MKCSRCQAENPAGMKFCGQCAAPLASVCPSCGASNPPGNKFCGQCAAQLDKPAQPRFAAPESYTPKHLAEKILTSKAALEGERKQVTVLFADLKGSMELLADRDPEEARKILDPVLERMMEAVHRYEGTVNQVMGDGIMALFGAPLAHEDHAVRACYAALRMQESVQRYAEVVRRDHGATIGIRVGLNSGEVVVRSIGSDLRMDYSAIGQTTHLAARMEQLAHPGAIFLTPQTLGLAEGFLKITPLGQMAVKGLPVPIDVYELVGATAVRSRLQATTAPRLSRFVGRDLEFAQLLHALDQVQERHGQVVAVVGEPGVGKSRLTFELTRSDHLDGWLVLHAGALSYGQSTSYLPVIQLLKNLFRIGDHDTPSEIREKLSSKVLDLDRSLENTLPALRALLDGHGDDPQWNALDPTQRRQQMLDAVKRVFLCVAQVQPVLVIVEDLHWIDTETQAVLQNLVESLPTARLLLLVNYRPEYQHNWGSKTYYRQLRLDPLRRENLDELLLALLGPDATVEPLKPVLILRTGGNPLFLEESVRTLVETNVLIGARGAHRLARMVDTIDMPRTVQAIIASRIDRLAPSDKQLLQTASVIGKDVPLALLLAITKLPEADVLAGLARLQATEFLYQTSSSPEPGYTFKHALTQEVAYGSLLHDHRRTLHAQIVDAIESLHGNRLGLEIERLALHAYRGHLREKAVDYLRQAGRKAAARCALRDAQAWFEQGLEVLEALPESPSNLEQAFEIRLGLRPVLNQLGEFSQALQLLRELETLAKRLNDERLQGRVCAFLTNVYSLLGRPDEGSAFGARALEIAKNLGDLELHIIARAFLAEAQYLRGEYNGVVELACANIAALPTNWAHNYLGMGAPASIYDRCWLSASLAQLGRFTEATEYQREAIQLAGSTNHAFTIGIAHYPAGTLHPLKGDWKKARAVIEDWIAVLRAGTVIGLLADAMAVSCWVLAQLGEMSEALRRLSEAEQLVERRATKGIGASGGWVYRSLGHARLLLGQLDKAQSWGERAVGSSTHQPGFAAHGLHLLGEIAAHPDRFDAESGAGHYRQALALAEPRGMRPLVAHCHLGLGKLSRRTNKREQAQEHLTTATTMYREMGMTYWLEKAEEESQALT